MSQFSNIKSLDQFLQLFKKSNTNNDNKITHTKIGNNKLNIYGGSYCLQLKDKNAVKKFYKLYHKKVIKKHIPEYLTELQNKEMGGPILVDLDFKFEQTYTERVFNEDIVSDMIEIYVEKIIELFDLKDIKSFQIYVLMKDEFVNDYANNVVKDGIHIQILLNTTHDNQLILREKVKNVIRNEVFEDLTFTNSIDDIFDKSIASGNTGWLLLGSRKPGGEPYKQKFIYNIQINDDDDEDYTIESIEPQEITANLLKKLSINHNSNPKINIKESQKHLLKNNQKKKKNTIILQQNHIGKDWIIQSFKNINSEDSCNKIIEMILANEQNSLSNIPEINSYIMCCLDEKFYEPFSNWIRVLWALKNSNKLLYPFFLKWSSQSDKFHWDDTNNINYIYEQWDKAEYKQSSLTQGSIRYWAKENNPTEFKKIRDNTTNSFIENTLLGNGTEHDIARLIHHLLNDKYRCTSIKSNRWYKFQDHKWCVSESGTGLRKTFSSFISNLYLAKQAEIMEKIRIDDDISDEMQNKLCGEAGIYNIIAMRLRNRSQKDNILTEAKELHFDTKLESRLDENPYLICFKNGIFDFQQKMFRDGIPEDYVSKCTDIDYIEIDRTNEKHIQIMAEINEFMAQLFPNERLRKYVWEHLASCLLGTNKNQTFNIYTGVGSNGKSVLVKLISMVLGDYKGTVPISLITQKRLGLGGTSSEVAQLKGLRYAVMNEPSKGDIINEGIMKELTGGDPIQARELYKSAITFIPMFKMACCTNTLFDIQSNDEGTWRRIRVVDFQSRFVDKPSDNPEDYEFKKNKSLENKFETWAPIFASMLVEIVLKTDGKVEDCEEVLQASKTYRENQDYLAKFVNEKIQPFVPNPENPEKKENKISKTNIQNEFKEWWKREYGTKCPKSQELVNYLNIRLGPYKRRGWWGFEIIYDDYDD